MSRTQWILLAAGIVVLYLWSKRSAGANLATYASTAASSTAAGDAATLATINGLANPNAGFYAGASTLRPAYTGNGWNPYPGWFRTDDGGWINPDTGETYSMLSSPPALPEPPGYGNPIVIDLSPTVSPTGPSSPYFIA